MIVNQLRTLLLNAPGNMIFPDVPGEEYVPPNYRPVAVPFSVQSVLTVLFGSSPDRSFLNFRLRQLMTLLHTTELAEFVSALDPRVTYWPSTDVSLFASVAGTTVTPLAGNSILNVIGTLVPNEAAGTLRYCWGIQVLDGSTVQVTTFAPGKRDHGLQLQ